MEGIFFHLEEFHTFRITVKSVNSNLNLKKNLSQFNKNVHFLTGMTKRKLGIFFADRTQTKKTKSTLEKVAHV